MSTITIYRSIQNISLCFTNIIQSKDVRSNWEYEYGFGASNELYTGPMSTDFVDMTFPQVAE